MALDLRTVAGSVQRMAVDLRASHEQRRQRLAAAVQTLEHPLDRKDPGRLGEQELWDRVLAAGKRKITWLAGKPPQGALAANSFAQRYRAPTLPEEYAALATDGSQIDVDRHGPAHCFLLNIGSVLIQYGRAPWAELVSQPYLYSRPEEMTFRDQDGVKEQPIEGALLGIKRMVLECEALETRLREMDPEMPVAALLDGSLVLWELSGERYPDYIQRKLLEEGLLTAFDRIFELSRTRRLSFGSYISLPRSTEVVNLLRLAYCPFDKLETSGCDALCGKEGAGQKQCNDVAQGLMDRDVLAEALAPGERSEVFFSQSPIVERSYGHHSICFFYLNVGGEIARVEVPVWVAENPDSLGLLHAALLDQCRKGGGYPVALQEAHEQAVVTMQDRRAFWEMVGASMAEHGLSTSGSLKARSKRTRSL